MPVSARRTRCRARKRTRRCAAQPDRVHRGPYRQIHGRESRIRAGLPQSNPSCRVAGTDPPLRRLFAAFHRHHPRAKSRSGRSTGHNVSFQGGDSEWVQVPAADDSGCPLVRPDRCGHPHPRAGLQGDEARRVFRSGERLPRGVGRLRIAGPRLPAARAMGGGTRRPCIRHRHPLPAAHGGIESDISSPPSPPRSCSAPHSRSSPITSRCSSTPPARGPVVFLLHGIGGNRTNWHDQLPSFADRGFCAVSWDARGYGLSDDYDGPLDFADFSHDLARLLDHLDVGRAHLVRLSMGGRILAGFYPRYPDRVATLVTIGLTTAQSTGPTCVY